MKSCLLERKLLNDGIYTNKIKIHPEMFLKAAMLISTDIMNCYDFSREKIGLLGIMRGALPLLTTVAHYLGIRKVSVMQVQMTNSDNVKDYGSVRFINEMLDSEVDSFIILEDIISHGRCSNLAINKLVNQGKCVKGIYSIVMNDAFELLDYDIKNIDVKYVYMINDKQWVHFFWEKGYLD